MKKVILSGLMAILMATISCTNQQVSPDDSMSGTQDKDLGTYIPTSNGPSEAFIPYPNTSAVYWQTKDNLDRAAVFGLLPTSSYTTYGNIQLSLSVVEDNKVYMIQRLQIPLQTPPGITKAVLMPGDYTPSYIAVAPKVSGGPTISLAQPNYAPYGPTSEYASWAPFPNGTGYIHLNYGLVDATGKLFISFTIYSTYGGNPIVKNISWSGNMA